MRKQHPVKSPDVEDRPKRAASAGWSRADIKVPDIQDLAKRLRFAPQQGRIWLDDQRMMLMHISNLGSLRQELIEGMGKERARGLITRIGYQAGARDAQMTRRVRANRSTFDDFLAGPQLVSLEGIVFCEPLGLHIDVERRILRRFPLGRLRRSRGAHRQLWHWQRRRVLDAGGLCLRLHQRVHGPRDSMARG